MSEGISSEQLQRAIASPHSASPQQLLQLQRQYGNRAVERCIRGAQAERDAQPGGNEAARDGTVGGPIQRKFSFEFTANVGQRALLSGQLKSGLGKRDDHNTAYAHIMDAYKRYANAPDAKQELVHLHTMNALCKNYVATHADKNYKKTFSVQDLLARCEKELPNATYMARFAEFASGMKGVQSANKDALMDAHSDVFAVRNDKEALAEKLQIKADFFGANIAKQILLYGDLLSPAERAAITRYTDAQYMLINPAMAGNEGWLGAQVAKQTDLPPEVANDLTQTMDDNRAIGEMATQALLKLPSWSEGTVFRGETFQAQEGKALRKEGTTKRWPHLVSTSKNEGVSREFAKKATAERPVGVLFRFTKHQGGKDIESLSSVSSEKEVLFIPGTGVQVKKLIKKEALGKGRLFVEVDVEEVPGRPASSPRGRR